MRRVLPILVLLAALLAPSARAGSPDELPVQEMQQLLERIRTLVVEAHPEPFAALGEEGFEERYRDAVRACRRPMSPGAFHLEASRVLAGIGDAHTALYYSGPDRFLPIRLAWGSDGLGIVAASEEHADLVGAEVVAIGGRGLSKLLYELRRLVSSENLPHLLDRTRGMLTRESVLAHLGTVDRRGDVVLRLQQDGRTRAVHLSFADAPLPRPPDASMAWDWAVLPELETGWFALRHCPSPDERYRRDVADLFHEMAVIDAKHLVIDVRGNPGGDSGVLGPLLERLPPETVVDYGGFRRLSAHALEQRELKPEWYTMRPDSDLTEPTDGAWSKSPRAKRLTPFAGDVFVLTDAGTFSSGNWVAVVLSDNGLACTVGEATGNAPSSYGDALGWDLGHGLWLSVSFTKWLRPDRSLDPADTLPPCQEVRTTLADRVDGADPQFEWLARRFHPDAAALDDDAIEALRPVFAERPTVVTTEPPTGATAVDPALGALTITFSEPMSHGSWSIVGVGGGQHPETGDARWTSPTTLVVPVSLEPGIDYAIGFNSRRYDGFRAEDGRPAVPHALRFRTATTD
jgi:hypothetical protein